MIKRGHLKKGKFVYVKPEGSSPGRQIEQLELLRFVLKRMDGCFEDGIPTSDDVCSG
jgi:hypothetical protein